MYNLEKKSKIKFKFSLKKTARISYCLSVMHDRLHVIGGSEGDERLALVFKPLPHGRIDVVDGNVDFAVSLGMLMLVIQPDGVTELVKEEAVLRRRMWTLFEPPSFGDNF